MGISFCLRLTPSVTYASLSNFFIHNQRFCRKKINSQPSRARPKIRLVCRQANPLPQIVPRLLKTYAGSCGYRMPVFLFVILAIRNHYEQSSVKLSLKMTSYQTERRVDLRASPRRILKNYNCSRFGRQNRNINFQGFPSVNHVPKVLKKYLLY